jgi:hypothetical protein
MVICKSCGSIDPPLRLSWQVFSNGTTHIRGDCSYCGRYVAYVPQTEDNLELIGPPPQGKNNDSHQSS